MIRAILDINDASSCSLHLYLFIFDKWSPNIDSFLIVASQAGNISNCMCGSSLIPHTELNLLDRRNSFNILIGIFSLSFRKVLNGGKSYIYIVLLVI